MKVIRTVNSKGNGFKRFKKFPSQEPLDALCNISARMIPRNKNDGKYRRQVGSIMTDREITCCLLATRLREGKTVITKKELQKNRG